MSLFRRKICLLQQRLTGKKIEEPLSYTSLYLQNSEPPRPQKRGEEQDDRGAIDAQGHL